MWVKSGKTLDQKIRITGSTDPDSPQNTRSLLASLRTWEYLVANRESPVLFDEIGNLKKEWNNPLTAYMKKGMSTKWNELEGGGNIVFSSPRFRDIVEYIEPGVHIFIPVDVECIDQGNFRTYVFFAGHVSMGNGLALKANGIDYRLSENGKPILTSPQQLNWINYGGKSDCRFSYLNINDIDSYHLQYAGRAHMILSDTLVKRLGDILHPGLGFIPMGVVHETLEDVR